MKVKIHESTYIFLLLAFLAGYFEYMYLFLLIIFVHESGHYFFSKIVHFKYAEIIIYPFATEGVQGATGKPPAKSFNDTQS